MHGPINIRSHSKLRSTDCIYRVRTIRVKDAQVGIISPITCLMLSWVPRTCDYDTRCWKAWKGENSMQFSKAWRHYIIEVNYLKTGRKIDTQNGVKFKKIYIIIHQIYIDKYTIIQYKDIQTYVNHTSFKSQSPRPQIQQPIPPKNMYSGTSANEDNSFRNHIR